MTEKIITDAERISEERKTKPSMIWLFRTHVQRSAKNQSSKTPHLTKTDCSDST